MKYSECTRWIGCCLLAGWWTVTAEAEFAVGSGTPATPYLVSTAEHLNNVRNHLDAHFRQTADIDLGTAPWNEGHGWIPIGMDEINEHRFTGRYDGQEHRIEGLTMMWPDADTIGLFAVVEGEIERVTLVDANVEGYRRVGALAGQLDSGGEVIQCVSLSGRVRGRDFVGGLIGRSEYGIVSGSHAATGEVEGDENVGGLAGFSLHGTVENSHASGTVTASRYAGGLVGQNNSGTIAQAHAAGQIRATVHGAGGLVGYMSGGIISNTYSTAEVTASEYGGGLVGFNNGTIVDSRATGPVSGSEPLYPLQQSTGGLVGYHSGTILRSYATGHVQGEGTAGGLVGSCVGVIEDSYARGNATGERMVGGLVGINAGKIRRSFSTGRAEADERVGGLAGWANTQSGEYEDTANFWDTQTSQWQTSAMGEGRLTEAMKTAETFTSADWDFETVWALDPEGFINGGYPYLPSTISGDFWLTYTVLAGGHIAGEAVQLVPPGGDGSPVSAIADPGALFHRWSDGVAVAGRTNVNVRAHLSVNAHFRTPAGVDIDWYAEHEIEPGPGQTWEDLDHELAPGKKTTYREEFVADTNPHDPGDIFRIGEIHPSEVPQGGWVIHFHSSPRRNYTLQITADLVDGPWEPVLGAGPRLGVGGPDFLLDTNVPPAGSYYRLGVEVP